jgi:hypothetical protein
MTVLFQQRTICEEGIDLHLGRDRTLAVTIETDVGDITGSKLWFMVKKKFEDTDNDAVITKLSANNGGSDSQAMVTSGTLRMLEFYIVPADTVSLDFGDYVADAVIELPNGRRLQLLQPFRFTLIQPVSITS